MQFITKHKRINVSIISFIFISDLSLYWHLSQWQLVKIWHWPVLLWNISWPLQSTFQLYTQTMKIRTKPFLIFVYQFKWIFTCSLLMHSSLFFASLCFVLHFNGNISYESQVNAVIYYQLHWYRSHNYGTRLLDCRCARLYAPVWCRYTLISLHLSAVNANPAISPEYALSDRHYIPNRIRTFVDASQCYDTNHIAFYYYILWHCASICVYLIQGPRDLCTQTYHQSACLWTSEIEKEIK